MLNVNVSYTKLNTIKWCSRRILNPCWRYSMSSRRFIQLYIMRRSNYFTGPWQGHCIIQELISSFIPWLLLPLIWGVLGCTWDTHTDKMIRRRRRRRTEHANIWKLIVRGIITLCTAAPPQTLMVTHKGWGVRPVGGGWGDNTSSLNNINYLVKKPNKQVE